MREAALDDCFESGVLGAELFEKINEAAFVDGDEPGFVRGPGGGVRAGEGGEELEEDIIVNFVTLVLAAVVIGLELAAVEFEAGAVAGAVRGDGGALGAGFGFDLLNESGFAVASVSANQNQAEGAVERCRLEGAVESRGDVNEAAHSVQTTSAGVGAAALAVKGEEVRDKGVRVGPGRT